MDDYVRFKTIVDEIDTLISNSVTSEDESFISWHTKADRFIRKYYGDGPEFKDFSNTIFGLICWTSSTTHRDEVEACKSGLISTRAKFVVYLEEMSAGEVNESVGTRSTDICKIFIVHGHDGELKEKVARLVEKQGLSAVILSEQANLGNTIIEKFEKNSDVGAAICLFTADDKCFNNGNISMRARQNVVFEAGFFMGKLGRDKVIMIATDDVEMPSDLSGVVYSNRTSWEFEVLKELKMMGYSIDLNKAL